MCFKKNLDKIADQKYTNNFYHHYKINQSPNKLNHQ